MAGHRWITNSNMVDRHVSGLHNPNMSGPHHPAMGGLLRAAFDNWIRERTLELSRKLNRKVGQGDIVRIALRRIWREYELDRDKNCLIEILRRIKQ
jgi:hypothetical protein